jgi:hypothetical protein
MVFGLGIDCVTIEAERERFPLFEPELRQRELIP